MSKKYMLTQGLGDCLLVGAILQKMGVETEYFTNPLIRSLFEYHPTIKMTTDVTNAFQFKWVSQLPQPMYGLHTMLRFSTQVDMDIDPSEVLDIYGADGKKLRHTPDQNKRVICINQFASERSRRYIPDKWMNWMAAELQADGFQIQYIGSNHPDKNSITDIESMKEALLNCAGFIGPVSFCYHFASCLHVPSLLFTGYMPAHKFSHFFNTVHIENNRSKCALTCERDNKQCNIQCDALNYTASSVLHGMNKFIQGIKNG